MKVFLLPLLALLSLSGCHAARDDHAPAVAATAATSSSTATNEKTEKKARDQMMDKSMGVQDQHWAATENTPVTTSSAIGASADIGAQARPATASTTSARH